MAAQQEHRLASCYLSCWAEQLSGECSMFPSGQQADIQLRYNTLALTVIDAASVHSDWLAPVPTGHQLCFTISLDVGVLSMDPGSMSESCSPRLLLFWTLRSALRAPSPKSNDICDKGIRLLTAFKGMNSEPF